MLTKSGESLVLDIKRTLEFIGFNQAVDIDDGGDSTSNKQEDLQIRDMSPLLLVEIKGLSGMPTESDTLQVTKYVLRRMREMSRTDVIGVSIVNHQRNLPGLERNHSNAFTAAQVSDAEQNGTGLITTWDLFRLIRGMDRWNWPPEAVRAILYGKGRLQCHPAHYVLAGTVAHYWTDKRVISIALVEAGLRVGDRVGYLLSDGFFEEDVVSLQVDKASVHEVCGGQRAGMKTTLARKEIPVGTLVFCVSPWEPNQT